MVVSLVKDKTD